MDHIVEVLVMLTVCIRVIKVQVKIKLK